MLHDMANVWRRKEIQLPKGSVRQLRLRQWATSSVMFM